MVKIPKADVGKKLIFLNSKGKFVKESERYQKATRVLRKYRRKWVEIYHRDEPISPKTLANLVPRDEFESLAANYGNPVGITTKAKKYVAWSLANRLDKNEVRGLRGHTAKVSMKVRDGKRQRTITFYHRFRRKGSYAYSVFKAMNQALGSEGLYFYNRLGSKLLPDRVGRKIHLEGLEVAIEL